MASVDRTAYPRFKRTTSAREPREAFQHRLLVLLVKSYQRLGGRPPSFIGSGDMPG